MDSLTIDQREAMIGRIEGWFGTLESLQWHMLSDADLAKIYGCMVCEKLIRPIKGGE